jgi:hypothetical protein
MHISTAPRHRNSGRPPEKDARGFLQWIRGRECLFAFTGECEGKIEAMHLDFAGGKGVGTKVADRYAIPGCARHHRMQHDMGWSSFCKMIGVTMAQLLRGAETMWNAWPGRIAWEKRREEGR